MLRNVKAIWISEENVLSLYSKEEKALNKRFFSSFLAQNGGDFLSEINFFLVASEKFLVASGEFFVAVGVRGPFLKIFEP